MNQTTKNCFINTFADQKCDNIIKVPKLKLKLSYCVDDYVIQSAVCSVMTMNDRTEKH